MERTDTIDLAQLSTANLYESIAQLLQQARSYVFSQVNQTMTKTYFSIGRMIIEDEQKGNKRANYGEETLKLLSAKLVQDFGRGFSVTNLKQMKTFYLTYQKSQTLSDQFTLSWSHYIFLMRLDEGERDFYEKECKSNNRSLRELKRHYDSSLYERVVLSRDKHGVIEENMSKYHLPESPKDIVKEPYIFEFLGLEESIQYSETDLEGVIISKIEDFLLELGKGFTFVGRQQRFTFDEQHFFVDLVFYNRLLQCFVIIDLKMGQLKHQDLGQMQMYVNYYDRYVKQEFEHPTIGILLCKNKSSSLVEITLPQESNIFASQYKLYLPSKEQLQEQLQSIIV